MFFGFPFFFGAVGRRASQSFFLLEDGSFLRLEDGSGFFLLEESE